MNTTANFDDIVDRILRSDQRYPHEAYHFVREALDFTQEQIHKTAKTTKQIHDRHVTGQQLLEGIRKFTVRSFGPMGLFVLHEWHIHECADFGEIVFNLVEHGRGMFGKTENDSRDDFHGGYCFEAAFREPFLPKDLKAKPALEPEHN